MFDRSGRSYVSITGTESTCVEQLLLRRKIMGPCKMTARNPSPKTRCAACWHIGAGAQWRADLKPCLWGGPGFIKIKGAVPNTNNFSHCKSEFVVDGIKGISVSDEHRNSPPPP